MLEYGFYLANELSKVGAVAIASLFFNLEENEYDRKHKLTKEVFIARRIQTVLRC